MTLNLDEAVRQVTEEIDKLTRVRQVLVDLNADSSNGSARPKSQKRVMSAAARERIRQAQRARWAKFHKSQGR